MHFFTTRSREQVEKTYIYVVNTIQKAEGGGMSTVRSTPCCSAQCTHDPFHQSLSHTRRRSTNEAAMQERLGERQKLFTVQSFSFRTTAFHSTSLIRFVRGVAVAPRKQPAYTSIALSRKCFGVKNRPFIRSPPPLSLSL